MDTMTLAQKLAAAGFKNVAGTVEHPGCDPRGTVVQIRPLFSSHWDENNGALVVYDESGTPWLRPAFLPFRPAEFGFWDQQSHGAYVPHSNDMGHEIRKIFPAEYARRDIERKAEEQKRRLARS